MKSQLLKIRRAIHGQPKTIAMRVRAERAAVAAAGDFVCTRGAKSESYLRARQSSRVERSERGGSRLLVPILRGYATVAGNYR